MEYKIIFIDYNIKWYLQAVTDAMLEELKSCFMEAYDDNQDGKIDIREVCNALTVDIDLIFVLFKSIFHRYKLIINNRNFVFCQPQSNYTSHILQMQISIQYMVKIHNVLNSNVRIYS